MDTLKRNLKIHESLYCFGMLLMVAFGAELLLIVFAAINGAAYQRLWIFWLPVVYLAIAWFAARMEYHCDTIRHAICLRQEFKTRKKLDFENVMQKTANTQPRALQKVNPKVR